jgi:acetyltransferase
LLRDRAARIAARELPGRWVLEVTPDHSAGAAVLGKARTEARTTLTRVESAAVLAAYGIASGHLDEADERASLRVHEDPTFGPAIGFSARPGGRFEYEMPPLNLPLAEAMARRAGLPAQAVAGAAHVLVRVSQLLVDEAGIGAMELDPLWIGPFGVTCGAAAIALRPRGEAAVLAIPPYPEQLVEHWESRGERFTIRPIRPEDAEAHAAFMRRLPPEDVRFRFFTAMREVAPEQMARLTQIDYEREMAFIAVRDRDRSTVGAARLVREAGEERGEFAIVVQPDVKGFGLASHLMQRLIDWGRDVGLAEISGAVLAENHPMLGFVRHLGFSVHRMDDEPSVVEAVLTLA